ncbi:MAG: DUF2970 domain-containing protein [Gammaproteobacteria bacterium]|nr:DUF2970 domain-containing protein [Gammaproteobacteria bacterium]MCP4088327.1 DUF2970 domain-containing protein [Gammaproteobacteria bacterium]MCP4276362.1 DUF2970 domain-containing protein [Gammaproteobacteria bacterium]MCP4831009.1 DUF2970 domain-containing protein [Gammaproteobacteria bacterium]MCP4927470.1 DUF2970 domain-containing protein [Gammaproteobacteria bacterium]
MASKKTKQDKPNLMQMIFSMIAAFCGIQSNQNHDRDNDHIDKVGFMPYIIIGIVMTFVLILALYLTVQLILT